MNRFSLLALIPLISYSLAIILVILGIYTLTLAIKALSIYIQKNS